MKATLVANENWHDINVLGQCETCLTLHLLEIRVTLRTAFVGAPVLWAFRLRERSGSAIRSGVGIVLGGCQ